MPNLTLRDGKTPSRYGLACGYQDVREFDDDNRVRLYADGACFHVQGLRNGQRFWHSFDGNELRYARKCFREICSQMRYSKEQS